MLRQPSAEMNHKVEAAIAHLPHAEAGAAHAEEEAIRKAVAAIPVPETSPDHIDE